MPRTKTVQEDEPKIENPYVPKHATILSYTKESSDCFTIRTDVKSNYAPGQFFQVSLPGIGEAPISVASYSPEYLDLNIRMVGNVTKAVSGLKKGDTIYIRGPYGNGYPMDDFFGKNLLLIGGGCGVAPLRGVISYVEQHRNDFADVSMYFGYRSYEDILFKDDLKTLKKKFNLNVTIDKGPAKAGISCDVCFVTSLLEKAKLNPERTAVLICGPPIMMKISIDILKNKGFREDQIFISAERLMNCAIGICGHCMIHGKYTCLDGPVFRYDEISQYKND